MMILPAVWRLLDPRQRRRLLVLQLLSVLMAISTVGGIAAVLPFFTVLADPNAVERSATLHFFYQHLHFGSERSFVIALGIALAIVVALSNAVNLVGTLMINRFAFQVGEAFHIALFGEYLDRSFAFHSMTHSSSLESKILHETSRVSAGILQSGLILITNLVTVVFITGSIVLLDPVVAASAMVGLGASYVAIYFTARGRLLRNGLAESRHYAERTKVVGESLGAIKEILLLQAQPFFVDKFARCCRSIATTIISTLAISQTPRQVLECVAVGTLVAVALHSSGGGEGAGPWIAHLTFVGFAAYRLLPALQQAFAAIVRIRADRPAFESIADDLRRARASKRKVGVTTGDLSWRGRPRQEIRLEEVSYSYVAEGPVAISNVSLRIPAGAVVGFIGANGSGKTTLLDLVAGLLVPESGYLEVDGIVVDDANRRAWQATIAQVPQDIFLLDAPLVENVAFAVSAAQIDLQRVRTAVGLARLDECIAALPNGYYEMLGERGVRLSGGQRQRLGIARALYREASVLIMDEATSALDAVAEHDIADALVGLRRNRTILLIAHRFSTLRHCDLIVELKSGRIFRSGTYDELLAPQDTRAANPARF
ncbi:MAG TPA: ABC transporter ATP-binding protein [Steroidobacteraceae bacterium]|jgi:ABC-type multidrug transport system fused ATPase/permease subunit|nr:ABC transporter ATP-binding protein [Steroidobacteraceae bacterium]